MFIYNLIRKKERRSSSRKRRVSPLTIKILSINVIAIFVVFTAVLHLDRYEDSLIQTELEGLERQATLFANALSEVAVARNPGTQNYLSITAVQNVIDRSALDSPARSRVFGTGGELLADSYRLPGRVPSVTTKPLASVSPNIFFQKFLDKFFQDFFYSTTQQHVPNYQQHTIQLARAFPEVISALRGSSIKTVKATTTGRKLLTVAMPIRKKYKPVLGVLLLSSDDKNINVAFNSYQKELIIAVVIAIIITSALSLYLSRSITRPIRRLASAAEKIRSDRNGRHEISEVSERNDELGELSKALTQMTDDLWQRLDAIEKFAADVAHEIKNPLTSIRSAVETASKIKDNEKRDKLLALILDDVHRLDRLITDISDSSRLDTELSREKFTAIDIGKLLLAFYELRTSQKKFGEKNLTLDIMEGNAELLILGHEIRIVQVIDNIVDNAITFSPPHGNINIVVSADTKSVTITIDDQGPGIPKGKLDAIFDRFYSERPPTEKFGLHSGLGLSICKQITEAHNGEITAENRLDHQSITKGARFIITLPRVTKEQILEP
ncbi:MAG: ATP-binding protein [Pseudomonadota bacterium]|nr:ATP-binding protein [Pseudomonadota bacterium]